jgi:hypothetical protein
MTAHDHAAWHAGSMPCSTRASSRGLELASSDVEVVLVGFGQTFQGRAGSWPSCRVHGRLPDLQVTVSNQVATDDQVLNACT